MGQPRASLDDDVYRLVIKARIKVNRSSGTVEQLYEIASLLAPGSTLELSEGADWEFTLEIYDYEFDAAYWALTLSLLRQARMGGVEARFKGMFADRADTFTLDGTPAQSLDAGLLSAAAIP